LNDQGSITDGGNDGIFSLRLGVQTCPVAQPASYTIGIGVLGLLPWR